MSTCFYFALVDAGMLLAFGACFAESYDLETYVWMGVKALLLYFINVVLLCAFAIIIFKCKVISWGMSLKAFELSIE